MRGYMDYLKAKEIYENRLEIEREILKDLPDNYKIEDEIVYELARLFYIAPRVIRKDLKKIGFNIYDKGESSPKLKSYNETLKSIASKKIFHDEIVRKMKEDEMVKNGIFYTPVLSKNKIDNLSDNLTIETKAFFRGEIIKGKIIAAARMMLYGFSTSDAIDYCELNKKETLILEKANIEKDVDEAELERRNICTKMIVNAKKRKDAIELASSLIGFSTTESKKQSKKYRETNELPKEKHKKLGQKALKVDNGPEIAYRLWVMGYRQMDIAKAFGVTRETVGNWIRKYKIIVGDSSENYRRCSGQNVDVVGKAIEDVIKELIKEINDSNI